jgi:hypothetical protein
MRERLFSRLGLDRCDLRPVGNYGGAVEQPWGHRQDGARFVPRPGDPREPSGGAPAGAVFCSLVDWGSFLIAHLIGERGGVGLLSAAGFRRLHTPLPGAEYAFGLYVTRPGWADGVSFSHNGLSDFLTVAWAVPDSDRILVLATNASGQAGDQAVGAALGALIRRTFGWFYLRPASAGATGTYLEVQAGRTAEGSPVALWPLTEAPAQHWKYQRTTRALQNEIGRCLTAGVGVETSFVVSARCTGESRQQWTFRKTGQIINANGACLAVEGTEGLRRAVLEDCDPDQVLHRWAVSRDP